MRIRNLLFGALSAAAALAVVWAIHELQLKQLEERRTVNVPVPAAFIPAGTLLAESMLEWIPLEEGALHRETVLSADRIVGMENIVPLGRHEPILSWKLERGRLMPARGEATFRIPREYVLSVSGSIRAGDAVRLFVSEPGAPRRLFDHDVIVASVRTPSGDEVGLDASGLEAAAAGDRERLYAHRRSGGSIDAIELNLTEEEWLMIDRLCSTGLKLVIALSPELLPAGPERGREDDG